jgi:hypothetical protein
MTQPNWTLTGQEDWQPSDWTYQRDENGFGMSYDVPAGQEVGAFFFFFTDQRLGNLA